MRRGYLTPPVMIILALITLGVALTLFLNTNLLKNIKKQPAPTPTPAINSFEDCARAGNRILLTYPRQCKTPDGKSFTEVINQESLDIAPCDVNSDGMCNVADLNLLNTALGTRRGQKNYHPLADLDADGVINDTDKQILLKLIEQNQSDETANWKTYINDKYRFQLNYPPSWVYREEMVENSFIIYFEPLTRTSSPIAARCVIQLSIDNSSKTAEKAIKSLCETEDICASASDAKDILIGNIKAKKSYYPGPIQTDVILFQKGTNIFKFFVDYDKSSETIFGISVEEKLRIFDQILSTFKFLD